MRQGTTLSGIMAAAVGLALATGAQAEAAKDVKADLPEVTITSENGKLIIPVPQENSRRGAQCLVEFDPDWDSTTSEGYAYHRYGEPMVDQPEPNFSDMACCSVQELFKFVAQDGEVHVAWTQPDCQKGGGATSAPGGSSSSGPDVGGGMGG